MSRELRNFSLARNFFALFSIILFNPYKTSFYNAPVPGGSNTVYAGNTYYYWIVARNSCGDTYSNIISVYTEADATVNYTQIGLRLRTSPGWTYPENLTEIGILTNGTIVRVIEGPVYALISSTEYGWWWKVKVKSGPYTGYTGWVWGNYLW